MNISERENALFTRWAQKHSGEKFVRDGVPFPGDYEKASVKITFVLKEANDFDSTHDNDMRTWIQSDGARWQTWSNIIRWTQAILDDGCAYPQDVDLFDGLKRISFLNLKKIDGGAQSKPAEIKKYAKADAEELLEQLTIYQPDIIVCCGKDLVADCLADFVFDYKGEWTHDEAAYRSCCWFYTERLGKTTAVLNCFHPINMGTGYANETLFHAIRAVAPKVLKGGAR